MSETQRPLRAYECNVRGKDWATTVHSTTAGKAKYEFWRNLREAWPEIPYTAVSARMIGGPITTDRFLKTAEYRGVPYARVGMRVMVGGMEGVIVGENASANFNVLFREGRYAGQTLNCHPLQHMAYLVDGNWHIPIVIPVASPSEKKLNLPPAPDSQS